MKKPVEKILIALGVFPLFLTVFMLLGFVFLKIAAGDCGVARGHSAFESYSRYSNKSCSGGELVQWITSSTPMELLAYGSASAFVIYVIALAIITARR